MVASLQRLFSRRRVFAQLFRECDDFEIVAACEPVANAQRGGARLAVDVDFGWHLRVL